MGDAKSYVHLGHARTQEQIDVMTQIQEDGVCPFCMEHFRTYHPKPILHENDHWIITENMSPYDGAVYHFLFVHKIHCTMPHELSIEARHSFFDLVDWAVSQYNIDGGSILIRFGDLDKTGGTVDHFHAHVVVGDSREHGGEKIKTKIGYKKT